MSGVVVSLRERRLARDGVKITFFKVLVKSSSVERCYPGGLDALRAAYSKVSFKKNLVGITFINLVEVNAFVTALEKVGIIKGQDLATANQIHGALDLCQGINFFTIDRPPKPGTHATFPVWYACAD